MPNPYSFVMGLDPGSDDDMKRRRAEAAAKDVPAFADRGGVPPEPAAPGGDWEGVESIGRAAEDIRRRAERYGQRGSGTTGNERARMMEESPRGDGLQGIQDTALDILARARAQGGRR